MKNKVYENISLFEKENGTIDNFLKGFENE